MGNKAAVDRVDAVTAAENGSKMVATGGTAEAGTSEAIERFGGPCRGRTYGPLIKSQLR